MDYNHASGYINGLLTLILGIFSWHISAQGADLIIKILTGGGALVASFFTARYFHYALKKLKRDEKAVS